jgi:biopolymer transport protein ExbD
MTSRLRAPLVVLALVASACASTAPPPAKTCPEPPVPASASAPPPAPTASTVAAIPYDLPRAEDMMLPPPALPGAATSQPQIVIFAVEITAGGAMSANGRPVRDVADLLRLAKDAFAKDPAVRAVIKADGAASWGSVIHAVDVLKQAGIARLAFAVSPRPAPLRPRLQSRHPSSRMRRLTRFERHAP